MNYLLFRTQNHEQAVAFHTRRLLNVGDVSQFRCDSVEHLPPDLRVGDLTPAKADSDLDLATIIEETAGIPDLKGYVVLTGLGTQTDFLDLRPLGFLGPSLLFGLFVQILAVIHHPANGRVSMGSYLDQVQVTSLGSPQGIPEGHNPHLLTVLTNQPNFFGSDALIDAMSLCADTLTS